MARMTPQQWEELKIAWENDPSASAAVVVRRLGLNVSVQAVNKHAKAHGWRKRTADATKAEQVSSVLKVSERKAETLKVSAETSKRRPKPKKQPANEIIEFDDLPKPGELTDRQEIFVREYMIDWNATQAAIRAGYSPAGAGKRGWELLQNPQVLARIKALANARAKRLGIEADDLTRLWAAMLEADVNEFVSLEKCCCEYCYGKDFTYQHTPSTLKKEQDRWERTRLQKVKAGMDDPGPFPPYTNGWYDPRKPPNPECPNCHGHGTVMRRLRDTRELSPAARALFMGVEEFQGDLNIKIVNKEKIHEWLAKSIGVWKDKEKEIETKSAIPEMLDEAFNRVMEESRRRTLAMYERRGLVEDIKETK